MRFPNFWNRKNIILLKELIKTDFKLRYQGSVLGYLWAVLRPMMMFTILYVVFTQILRFGNNIPHYPVYLLTGTILWNFFTECTNQGIQSIIQRGDLIRKISFPKYIIVISATSTALINLLINIFIVIVIAIFNGIYPNISWLFVVPLIIELYILSLGLSFLLGSINVNFRDISSIWDVFSQALFYAIPIIYPVSMVIEKSQDIAKIILLNPITQVIQDIRYCLITSQTITVWSFIDRWWLKIIPIIIVFSIFIIGANYFKKKSKYFAEIV